MNQIKCIIFDFGGVLISEKIEPVFKEANKILGKKAFVRLGKLHDTALKGRISTAEHYRFLSKETGVSPKLLRKTFTQAYLKIMKPNKNTIKIVKRLKQKGYNVAILSNTTEMVKIINKKYNIFQIFYPNIFSCDVGYMKPQKEIFISLLKRAKMKPEECMYIEDRKEFLATPRMLGIKTLHFKNSLKLEKDMRKLGVIL
ncbi:MAG: HAD family phosphatase [Candidatus Aenigmatarchaeota archaeon]